LRVRLAGGKLLLHKPASAAAAASAWSNSLGHDGGTAGDDGQQVAANVPAHSARVSLRHLFRAHPSHPFVGKGQSYGLIVVSRLSQVFAASKAKAE